MRKTKKNGFSWPLHPYQYLSYLLIFYELPCTCAFLCPVLLPPYQVARTQYLFIVVYVPLQVAVVTFGAWVTVSDPTDPVVYQHRKARDMQYFPRSEPFDSSRYSSVCTICGTAVSNSSKHCGYCNRCVERFDHHCKWLNNCIGHKNYAYFTLLISSLEIMELLVFAGSFWLLIEYFTNKEWLKSHVYEVYGAHLVELLFSCVCVQTVIAFLILVAIGNLIGLHLWLRKCKKMTTFEYILHIRNQRNTTVSTSSKSLHKTRESANLSDIQLLMPKKHSLIRKGTQVLPEDLVGESPHEIDETKRSRSEEERVQVI